MNTFAENKFTKLSRSDSTERKIHFAVRYFSHVLDKVGTDGAKAQLLLTILHYIIDTGNYLHLTQGAGGGYEAVELIEKGYKTVDELLSQLEQLEFYLNNYL